MAGRCQLSSPQICSLFLTSGGFYCGEITIDGHLLLTEILYTARFARVLLSGSVLKLYKEVNVM